MSEMLRVLFVRYHVRKPIREWWILEPSLFLLQLEVCVHGEVQGIHPTSEIHRFKMSNVRRSGSYLPVYVGSNEVLFGMWTGGTFNSQRAWFDRVETTGNVGAASTTNLSQMNPGPQRKGEFVVLILTSYVH